MTRSVSRGDFAACRSKRRRAGDSSPARSAVTAVRVRRAADAQVPLRRPAVGRAYLPRTARPAQSRRMRAGVPPRRVARGPHGFPGRFAARRRERAHGRVHAALPCAAFFRVRLPASPCGGTHAPQPGLRNPSERPPVQNSFPSNDFPSSTWSILPAGPAGASRDVIPSDRLIVPPAARPFSSAGTA